MKVIALWLASTLTAFAALAGGYHAYLDGDPRRVLVVIDASYEMKPVWHKLPSLMDSLDNARYSRFALTTEKSQVHGWRRTLNLGSTVPYAPRDFTNLAKGTQFPQVEEAEEIILITNAPARDIEEFSGWTLIRP